MKKTAEEILKDNLSENLWTFINSYPVARGSDKMLKDWIIDSMEAYTSQSALTKERVIEILEKYIENGFIEMVHINVEQIASEIEALPQTKQEQASKDEVKDELINKIISEYKKLVLFYKQMQGCRWTDECSKYVYDINARIVELKKQLNIT